MIRRRFDSGLKNFQDIYQLAVTICPDHLDLPMKSPFSVLWERHLAAMIVAGSHSHKNGTSLPSRMAPRAITRFLRSHQL